MNNQEGDFSGSHPSSFNLHPSVTPSPELWNQLAERAQRTLTADQHRLLSRYLDLLLAANATMNLTRIRDRAAAELLHIADALTLLPFLPAGEHRLADVGSGGGVPGIPLAIVRPDSRVVLLESTRKKAAYLETATRELGLGNVQVRGERAEDAGRSELRGTFDVAVARAVGTLDWLAEWCLPLVKRGGAMLAMKGPRVVDELAAAAPVIRLLGGGEPHLEPANLPGAENHVIVRIEKKSATPARFPRAATQTKGKPLA